MEKSSQDPSFGQGLELISVIAKAMASAAKKNKVDLDRVQTIVGKPGLIFRMFDELFAEESGMLSVLQIVSDEKSINFSNKPKN